jgi:predicted DNA-binding WGR domain protein
MSAETEQPVFVLLQRINVAKNEARFYLVTTGPSLLDPHAVFRTWGRMGGFQRSMITPCATAVEAERVAGKFIRRRLKRGYHLAQGALPEGVVLPQSEDAG